MSKTLIAFNKLPIKAKSELTSAKQRGERSEKTEQDKIREFIKGYLKGLVIANLINNTDYRLLLLYFTINFK